MVWNMFSICLFAGKITSTASRMSTKSVVARTAMLKMCSCSISPVDAAEYESALLLRLV